MHCEYEGRFVAELAASSGKDPYDWVFDALLETRAGAEMIVFQVAEDNLALQLRHPAMMIGTDADTRAVVGPLATGLPHPRHYGTFPRILARYVRELGTLSLEEAVHKMSGLPAQKLRWPDRGMLKQGFKADVVVLDPATVADRATYEAPHQYPVGIAHVIVNGKPVIHDGVHTHARPGRVL
jgi:N-acyl-D-aspartate/D-glutamate deacylase